MIAFAKIKASTIYFPNVSIKKSFGFYILRIFEIDFNWICSKKLVMTLKILCNLQHFFRAFCHIYILAFPYITLIWHCNDIYSFMFADILYPLKMYIHTEQHLWMNSKPHCTDIFIIICDYSYEILIIIVMFATY